MIDEMFSSYCKPQDSDIALTVREIRINKRRSTRKLIKQESFSGIVWVCGQGESGQLGFSAFTNILETKNITPNMHLSNIIDVKTGSAHSIVLTMDGEVFTFGSNQEGALGRETYDEIDCFSIQPVSLPEKASKISAGETHSACLLENGDVYVWGSFRYHSGHIGYKPGVSKWKPVRISRTLPYIDVVSGYNHLIVLTKHGNALTVGNGERGQLGRIFNYSRDTKGRVASTLSPGEVYTYDFQPIERIWATANGSFIEERYSGRIFAFGQNDLNQLCLLENYSRNVFFPVESFLKDIHTIAGGPNHTLILTKDRSVYFAGQLKYATSSPFLSLEREEDLKHLEVFNGKKVCFIDCGHSNCHALTENGKLYSWGCGVGYQLGNGSTDNVPQPTLMSQGVLKDRRFVKLSSGTTHTLYLTDLPEANLSYTSFKTSELRPRSTFK